MANSDPKMKTEDLIKFLIETNQHGYASTDIEEKKEKDSSHTIIYSAGDWMMHDNYFGGETYGGREVIFYQDKPVWIMVYYGRVLGDDKKPDHVYAFLKEALKRMPAEKPFRGPDIFKKDNFVYKNIAKGDIINFSGEETISENDEMCYLANYMGGLVDVS